MTFPRYADYKDSGIEWLGEVPAHWEQKPIKHVSTISYGIAEPPQYKDSGTPLIRATNIHEGKIFNKDFAFVNPDDIPSSKIIWLSPGDIIVVRSGAYTGDSAIILDEHCPSIAGFDMVLRIKTCHPMFMQYALLSQYIKKYQIDIEKIRAAQPHINANELGKCFALIPPLPEQTAIAAFLDHETGKIDALVTEQEKLIALLKEKRQAVISHAVTKGLDPSVSLKDSGIEWLGEVPEHWEVVPIKYYTSSIEQGWSPQCEGFPVETAEEWGVLKVGCVNGGVFNPLENKTLPEDLEPIPSLGITVGDLLISRANTKELVGGAAVAHANYPRLMLCDKLYRLRLDKTTVLPDFIVSFLGTGLARGQIELAATGASSSMQNIGQGTILGMATPLPPLPEQTAIVAYLDAQTAKFDALTAEAERAIALLKERRSALISAAVTGKIDVRGFVAPTSQEAA
ncbi:restriction endonuclease subunit S [Insolitispirillum peregrinum]|uniref:restriction endonuclease subunit S n=1 Tax=Insolitispirillum peregrinum TaxID=80876 RepID=UPI00360D9C29